MAAEFCSIPSCHGSGPVQVFKHQGLNTLIKRSQERNDSDLQAKLKSILDSQGESASIFCHKSCYCAYTSKQNVARTVARNRKDKCTFLEGVPQKRRRSQLESFRFREHCLICGDRCVPKDPRHPDRWERAIQCETTDRPGRPSFKDTLLDICD